MTPRPETSPTDRLRELVRAEIRKAGVGERSFEERVGLRRWSLRGFLDPERQQSPSLDRAAEIAEALGLEFRMDRPGQVPGRELAEPDPDSGDLGRAEGLRSGFLPIPYHAASGRRGMGPMAFSRAWLADEGLAPEGLFFVAVDRSFLAPAVPDGALALVDSAAPRGEGAEPWCFREEGEDRLAYLHWIERGGLVIGGAAGAPPRVLTHGRGVTVLGRVVWTGAAPPG